MYTNTYREEIIEKNQLIKDSIEPQLTIQIGISLWVIFLVHFSHIITFKGAIYPVSIDKSAFVSYYTIDLLNIAVPLYLYSHGWKLANVRALSFQNYLNHHMKFLLPGFFYGLLIFIIKNLDKLEPTTEGSVPVPNEDWSWSVSYHMGLISIFIYHFLVAIIMYPIICLIKKVFVCQESFDEYGIISSSELFNKVDKDVSESIKISNKYGVNQNFYGSYDSSNSSLAYIISNIIIYFLIINIFYYFSFGSYLYIIYTFFYTSIFLIHSLKFIQKEISIGGICIFMNIVYILLYSYLTSGFSSLAFNNGTIFFKTLFIFLIYFFTGFTMAFSDPILRIQKYYLDILLLIPILYNLISIPERKFMYSPLVFPISFQQDDQFKTIISSWIGIIFTISIVFRFFGKSPIKHIVKFIFKKIPYILIILVTIISFIYERAAQITNGF